jgi:hypothetical protein
VVLVAAAAASATHAMEVWKVRVCEYTVSPRAGRKQHSHLEMMHALVACAAGGLDGGRLQHIKQRILAHPQARRLCEL